MAWQKHLVGSVEISIMIPILTKMNNREYDLETVPVNFEIPSFGSCAVLLCVREKELLSCISRSVRSISQYSYKIMSPSLLTAVSQTGQDRTGHLSARHGLSGESSAHRGRTEKQSQQTALPIGLELKL